MDEVVVVGYGSQKKVNVTGSVSMVDSKVIESRPVTKRITSPSRCGSGIEYVSR